jgi:hypothetical protein
MIKIILKKIFLFPVVLALCVVLSIQIIYFYTKNQMLYDSFVEYIDRFRPSAMIIFVDTETVSKETLTKIITYIDNELRQLDEQSTNKRDDID